MLLWARAVLRVSKYGGFVRQVGAGRVWASAIAWLLLAVALLSPVAVFGSFWLSSHMLQHLILVQVAAPLFLIGRPVPLLLLGLPQAVRRDFAPFVARSGFVHRLGRLLSRPFVGLALFLVVFFGWHVPGMYDLAVRNAWIHYFEHLTFFVSALVFWWPAVDPLGNQGPRRQYLSMISQGVAFAAATGLGIAIGFNREIVYDAYRQAPRLFGFSAADDQMSAGLIMWVFGGLLYTVSALATLAAANKAQERAQLLRERRATLFAGYTPG